MQFNRLLLILSTVLGFCNSAIFAQEHKIARDSLELYLENHTARDTHRVNVLVDIQDAFLLDEHEKGREYAYEALEISEELGYLSGIGFSSNAIASIYMRDGEKDSALIYIMKAIEVFEAINEDQNIYAAYNNLALVYKSDKEYERALHVYERVLKRLEGREETSSFAIVYFNIAAVYEAMQDWQNYEAWILKVQRLSEKLGFKPGLFEAELGLAKIAIQQGDYDEAIERANSLLDTTSKFGEMSQIEARAYLILGDANSKKTNYEVAINDYTKSLEIYQKVNSPHYAAEIHFKLAELFQSIENYKSAFEHRTSFHHIQDSLNSLEKMEVIEELQAKYETERIEREKDVTELENLKLADENRKARSLLFAIVGLLTVLVLVFVFYMRQQDLKKQNELVKVKLLESEKRLTIEQQKRVAELKAVRSQLNPHFIFNLLNSVQELNITGNPVLANKALNNMATLMRLTLKNSQESLIPLKDEIMLVRKYLEAEMLRFGDKISCTITIDEQVEDEFIKIPPMLIQPFVENAIQHGLMHKIEHGEVSIWVRLLEPELLEICVEDNGVGRKKSAEINSKNPGKHNRFSTQANQQRIHNLAVETNTHAKVEIIDKTTESGAPDGTKVCIFIPTNLGS